MGCHYCGPKVISQNLMHANFPITKEVDDLRFGNGVSSQITRLAGEGVVLEAL
jgi:hypothetical protein